MRKLTKRQIEAMTREILGLLCSEEYSELWVETSVFSDGKRYAACSAPNAGKTRVGACDVFVTEDCAPSFSRFLPEEDSHILSMTFEGPLHQVLNFNPDYDLPGFMEKFDAIFQKYGVFYELMESWCLTCHAV